MDALTFISEMTAAIAWPAIVVFGVYLLRAPLSSLIPKMQKLKFRDLEADFQTLSVSDQSLLFLDGVARKDQWTFFEKIRPGERELGQAFLVIVKDLLNVEKNELIKKLKQWLQSGEKNLIWFATEIIGYFKIVELKNNLSTLLPANLDNDLDTHELNCLWAHARISNIDEFADALMATKISHNQTWLLFCLRTNAVGW